MKTTGVLFLFCTAVVYSLCGGSAAHAMGCNTPADIQARCPCGVNEYVRIKTFYSGIDNYACYRNQGDTVPCPSGCYVFTASPDGTCNYAKQVCNWGGKPAQMAAQEAQEGRLLTNVYFKDCDGHLSPWSGF